VKKYIPIGIFILLVALLGFGLSNDPKKVPSPFIDKPVPPFDTTRLYKSENISTESMKGKVWLLNVFASWCASCRAEHKLFNYYLMLLDVLNVNNGSLLQLEFHQGP